jgi:hypothetical protein
VLAGAGSRHRLIGVEVIGGRDRDDVDVGCTEKIVVVRRDARARTLQAISLEVRARTASIAPVQPRHARVGVALKGGDMLCRAPADASDADTELSTTRGHGIA